MASIIVGKYMPPDEVGNMFGYFGAVAYSIRVPYDDLMSITLEFKGGNLRFVEVFATFEQIDAIMNYKAAS